MIRPAPKPQKPTRGTKEAKEHMHFVAMLPCVCCGRYGVQVHHVIHDRFAQRKSSDLETIPLCRDCHDELHNGKGTWERTYGSDHGYIEQTRLAVEKIKASFIYRRA